MATGKVAHSNVNADVKLAEISNNVNSADIDIPLANAIIQPQNEQIKCSAIHTLERDMPNFDYSDLVHKLRVKILEEVERYPECYSQCDIDMCKNDDWHISRFLLRQKLDLDAAYEMLKKAMRYKHESMNNSIRAEDFPAEFYKIGGLFSYERDRKGNKVLHMRVKVHKKIPELQLILETFVFFQIDRIDKEAGGKGIAILIDCTGGGISNADIDTLMFLISSLTNYFPKGLSYLLVHELPWVLKPIWHIAKLCVPEEYKQLIKFSDSRSIFEYIDEENLPDYMGGTCETSYRRVPENCTTLKQAAKLWGIDKDTIRRVMQRFSEHLPDECMSQLDELDEDYSLPDQDDSEQENKPNDDWLHQRS